AAGPERPPGRRSMWARRCGAPPRWPSRVKVIFFSFFSGTIGMSIYTYMAASNISFLEVESPASEAVLCLTDWPMRDIPISWTTPVDLIKWWTNPGLDVSERMRQHRCSVPALAGATCGAMAVPVRDVKRPLALAMDWDAPNHYDVLGVWARLFLTITFLIWVGMTTHDLALIGRSKNYILDLAGVNEHCPLIRKVWRRLVGLKVNVMGAWEAWDINNCYAYVGNSFTDAQITLGVFRYALQNTGISKDVLSFYFGGSHIPLSIQRWAGGGLTCVETGNLIKSLWTGGSKGKTNFECQGDAMSHHNKGAVALRLGFQKDIAVENVTISNLMNKGVADAAPYRSAEDYQGLDARAATTCHSAAWSGLDIRFSGKFTSTDENRVVPLSGMRMRGDDLTISAPPPSPTPIRAPARA
ncbi:unnamed protein product, partial [Prorocentrum cordatum]